MAKHTRRQLLAHIGQIQNELGLALEYSTDDRNPNRAACLAKSLKRAHELCVAASSTDRPVRDIEMRYLGFRIDLTRPGDLDNDPMLEDGDPGEP